MRRLVLTLLVLIISIDGGAQLLPQPNPTLKDGWQRIYIKGVGNIDIPPTMEVQKGKYKEFQDEVYKIKGYDAPSIAIQQKGLGEFKKESFERYARAIIETIMGKPGEFAKLNFDISTMSGAGIKEIDNSFKQEIQQALKAMNMEIIEWYPLKLKKINGMSCFYMNFKRQLKNSPPVLVSMYMFENHDRGHRLTLSYRIKEENYWKDDFETILNSFRITNIRK